MFHGNLDYNNVLNQIIYTHIWDVAICGKSKLLDNDHYHNLYHD